MGSAASPTTSPRSETRLPTKDTGRLARVANQECLSRSEIQGGWKINVIMSGFGKSDYFAFGYLGGFYNVTVGVTCTFCCHKVVGLP